MTVTSATSTQNNSTAATSTSQTSPSKTVDYDAFLRILVTEMQNQDPTAPNDPAQFVSQLASFSGVEQQINANNKLSAILSSLGLNQAGGMIGRTVTSADGAVSGEIVSVRITSDGAAATLNNGKQVTLGAGVTIS